VTSSHLSNVELTGRSVVLLRLTTSTVVVPSHIVETLAPSLRLLLVEQRCI
jgi:hypothetical protein